MICETNKACVTIVSPSDINTTRCRSRILSIISNPAHGVVIVMKVDLKKIAESIEFQDDEAHSYLKISSGEVVLFTDEAIAAAESDEDLSDHAEWFREAIEQARAFINNEDDYIPLPSKYEFHEYRVMEEFIHSLPIAAQRDDLLSLIKGKGAFARFKQGLERFLLLDEWYKYRDRALAALAEDWCRDNGIEFQ